MPDSLSIKEIIDKYGTYTGLTMGTSMRPLLHQQKDNIIVVKPKGRLKNTMLRSMSPTTASILCTVLSRSTPTITLSQAIICLQKSMSQMI